MTPCKFADWYEYRMNWNKTVMPAINERLDAFNNRGITPTLRTVFYALVSLGVISNIQSQYQYLSHFTARARENGQLPIDCFADQSRRIIQTLTIDMKQWRII